MATANTTHKMADKYSELTLFKKFLEATNPYSMYSNTDRFLNVGQRWQASGAIDKALVRWGVFNEADQNTARFMYESQTGLLSQFLWASTAIEGVGVSVRRPQLYTDEGSQTKVLAGLTVTRSAINAVLESLLLVGNLVRWSNSMRQFVETNRPAPNPALAGLGGIDQAAIYGPEAWANLVAVYGSEAWNPFGPNHLINGVPVGSPEGLEIQYGPREQFRQDRLPANYNPSAVGAVDGSGVLPSVAESILVNRQLSITIKNLRSGLGAITSAGFTVNALIAIGMASTALDSARNAEYGENGAEAKRIALATSSLTLISAIANVPTNAFKSLASYGSLKDVKLGSYKIGGWTDKANIKLNIAGTFFGVLNSAAAIASMVTM